MHDTVAISRPACLPSRCWDTPDIVSGLRYVGGGVLLGATAIHRVCQERRSDSDVMERRQAQKGGSDTRSKDILLSLARWSTHGEPGLRSSDELNSEIVHHRSCVTSTTV